MCICTCVLARVCICVDCGVGVLVLWATATCLLQDHLVPNGFEPGQATILDAACEDSFNSSPKVGDGLSCQQQSQGG